MAVIVRGWPWCEANGKFYFGGMHHIRNADGSTFEVLSKWWARDSRHVYSAGSAIRGADPESFTVLNELYAKDKNRAYTMTGPIKEADVSTFTAIGETEHPFNTTNGYAKDANFVYHTTVGGKACLVKAADPATFNPLGNGYGGDSKNVFCERRRLVGAKPGDWTYIRGPHSRSGDKAYCFGEWIRGARGGSLRSLPNLGLIDKWCRDDRSFFNRTSFADPREYFQGFRDWFVCVGRVDHVELTCHQDGDRVFVDQPDAWMIADHALIYIMPSKWLQRPNVPGLMLPEVRKPVRFGEAFHLPLLSKGNWMDEERIWMLKPSQEPNCAEPRVFFTCVDLWWQYLHLGELAFINGLIEEAQAM